MRPFVAWYDRLFAEKDYRKDIAVLERLAGHAFSPSASLLEIGAGTGNQSVLLAPRVARLTCVEIDPDFAELLERKLADHGLSRVTVHRAELSRLDAEGFELAVAFFNVLNYLPEPELRGLLVDIADRLAPGAPFIADVWNGDAVGLDPPRQELRRQRSELGEILVEITPSLGPGTAVTLDYRIEARCGVLHEAFAERLPLHAHPLATLSAALGGAGFVDVAYHDHASAALPAGPASWKVWLSARRAQETAP